MLYAESRRAARRTAAGDYVRSPSRTPRAGRRDDRRAEELLRRAGAAVTLFYQLEAAIQPRMPCAASRAPIGTPSSSMKRSPPSRNRPSPSTAPSPSPKRGAAAGLKALDAVAADAARRIPTLLGRPRRLVGAYGRITAARGLTRDRPETDEAVRRFTGQRGRSTVSLDRVFERAAGRLACTSTAMLPGLAGRIIFMCALGMSSQENTSDMQGSMRRSMTSRLAGSPAARWKCEPWTLLAHPHEARRR